MPSYEHKAIIEQIARLDEQPAGGEEFSAWIRAGAHLRFLHDNAQTGELAIYASGEGTFIHTMVVPNASLSPIDADDLLMWSCNPYTSSASYVSGGGRDDTWVERGPLSPGSKTLEAGMDLIFGRTFEGWTGQDRTYFEVHPEYTHLAGIHWRPEHRAYCRFDHHGDIEHVVSITNGHGGRENVTLVSFRWEPLEEYLTASDASLVRMFDFTLRRRGTTPSWGDGPEQNVEVSDDLFYRQKIAGQAAYTRGVQIIRPRRPAAQVYADIRDNWRGRRGKQYVEFIAHDWRNNRITNISTDPAATTNYFEAKNNTLPFELSPAFFRPEVLLNYKADRDKYTVRDREIHCRATWTLRAFDVNVAGQVHAYICYLRDLPHAEQLHWASFNEAPKATISQRAITHDFKGEFARFSDPLSDILSIVHRWRNNRAPWWTLRDERLIERVNTPFTTSRDEWGDAFMDLAKLVIEGFETKPIRAKLDAAGIPYEKDDKTITLIERLINTTDPSGDLGKLAGLRTVQLLRTKAKGHVGGTEADQLARGALLQHETFANHFRHVCQQVSQDLEAIESLFS